jgi:O-antigen/teichoic acid export membrane protein
VDRPDAAQGGPAALLRPIGNALANYSGSITALGATLAFNAYYARIVGAEVFGMVSLLLTVSLILPALDLGLGRTVGRIIAERLARQTTAEQLRNEVMTFQAINAAIGLLLGVALALGAETVASGWLRPAALSAADVAVAVALIGANIPCMMVRNFLTACFNGMQHQGLANALLVIFVLLRGGAGVLTLTGDSPSQTAFFLSQLLVNALDVLACSAVLWYLIPGVARRPRLDVNVVRRSWRFAANDGATNLIGIATLHGDKILLSTLLPLSSYGAYTLVATIAMGIGRLTGPLAVAFLPHFVELTSLGQQRKLISDYLLATQLGACVVLPAAATMIIFAPDIVSALLPTAHLAGDLSVVFALLVAAFTLSNLMQLPHALQLAAGNSATALRFNALNALVYVILVVVLAPRLAALAPALALLGVYGVSIIFFLRTTHQILHVSTRQWLYSGMLGSALVSVGVALAASWSLPPGIGPLRGSGALVLTILVGSCAAVSIAPEARRTMLDFLRHATRHMRQPAVSPK